MTDGDRGLGLVSTSIATVYTTGSVDTVGLLLDRTGTEIASNDDPDDGGRNFRITETLDAGTYYVRVSGYDSETGSYTVHLDIDRSGPSEARGPRSGQTDDHGSDADSATELTTSVSGRIDDSDDVDYFRIQVARRSTVTIFTTGSLDTVGRLEHRTAGDIASNDDPDDGGYNFRISQTLDAGTYYVSVRGYGSDTGSYTVHLSQDAHERVADGRTDEAPGTDAAGSDRGVGARARVAIVNPDAYRILKAGVTTADGGWYHSVAYGEVADLRSGCAPEGREAFDVPGCWTGVGEQEDFIGHLLEANGYAVSYYAAEALPAIDGNDFAVVVVQDPLITNGRAFGKGEMDRAVPDLLEHVLSSQFRSRITQYHRSGGTLLLVGDAVRLLEDGPNRLGAGKTVSEHSVANAASEPDALLPSRWLFVRGNPFCGHDRNGSASYTVAESVVPDSQGVALAELRLFNGNDLPSQLVWSDTIYAPADGMSLLDVRVTGTGEYVLRGDTCSPPVYQVGVDETVASFMGYTTWEDRKVFYLGSDSFFDYRFRNHDGKWHAGEHSEIDFRVTDAGEQAILALVEQAWAESTASSEGREERLPGQVFRDCAECPQLVVVPAGSFLMGSPPQEPGREDDEGPQRRVTIGEPFAAGVYEVTFAEWDACVDADGCDGYRPDDDGWGRGLRPVIWVDWYDAQRYVSWLSEHTGKEYRLLSEAEWEYAARAGTATPFTTGDAISTDQATYGSRGGTVEVGTFPANAFGLHDVHGNVWEWTEDCWNGSYTGAPTDGSSWEEGDCDRRVVRGGSWLDNSGLLRSANRARSYTGYRFGDYGFRVARTLTSGIVTSLLPGSETESPHDSDPSSEPATADDHGNDAGTATELIASMSGRIDIPDDIDYFQVMIRERSDVRIYTTGDLDTVGRLGDRMAGEIASNDDSDGGDYNFLISETLDAGTYYVSVSGYGDETGSYTVVLSIDDGARFPLQMSERDRLSSGGLHTCGLRGDGTPVCWGSDYYGQASPPSGERLEMISSGGWHTCGLRSEWRMNPRHTGAREESTTSMTDGHGELHGSSGDRGCVLISRGLPVRTEDVLATAGNRMDYGPI